MKKVIGLVTFQHYTHVLTVFNRIETVATINFSTVQVWLLIEGGPYSKAATINFVLDFRLCVITLTTNITYYIMVFEPRYIQ